MKTYRSTTTGLFVGRQADQIDGETYETVEVPLPKEELIEFLNTLQPTQEVDVNPEVVPPTLNSTDAVYAKVRQDVLQGNLDLDETLWNAPLDLCLRLATIIMERTREHVAKGMKNERAKSSTADSVEPTGTTE